MQSPLPNPPEGDSDSLNLGRYLLLFSSAIERMEANYKEAKDRFKENEAVLGELQKSVIKLETRLDQTSESLVNLSHRIGEEGRNNAALNGGLEGHLKRLEHELWEQNKAQDIKLERLQVRSNVFSAVAAAIGSAAVALFFATFFQSGSGG